MNTLPVYHVVVCDENIKVYVHHDLVRYFGIFGLYLESINGGEKITRQEFDLRKSVPAINASIFRLIVELCVQHEMGAKKEATLLDDMWSIMRADELRGYENTSLSPMKTIFDKMADNNAYTTLSMLAKIAAYLHFLDAPLIQSRVMTQIYDLLRRLQMSVVMDAFRLDMTLQAKERGPFFLTPLYEREAQINFLLKELIHPDVPRAIHTGIKKFVSPLHCDESGNIYIVIRDAVSLIANDAIREALLKENGNSSPARNNDTKLANPVHLLDNVGEVGCFGAYKKGYFMSNKEFLSVTTDVSPELGRLGNTIKSMNNTREIMLVCVNDTQLVIVTKSSFFLMSSLSLDGLIIFSSIRVRLYDDEGGNYVEINADQVIDLKGYVKDEYAFIMRDGTVIVCMHPFSKKKGRALRLVSPNSYPFVSLEIKYYGGESFIALLMTANNSFYSVSSRNMAFKKHGTLHSPSDPIHHKGTNIGQWLVPRQLTVLPKGEVKQYVVCRENTFIYTTTGLYVAGSDLSPHLVILDTSQYENVLDGFVPVVLFDNNDDNVATTHIKEIDSMCANDKELVVMMRGGIYTTLPLHIQLQKARTFLTKIADYPIDKSPILYSSSLLLCSQCMGGRVNFIESSAKTPYCSYSCHAIASYK